MKENKNIYGIILLTTLFLLISIVAISCSKPSSNIPKVKKTKYTAIDYFDVTSPNTIKSTMWNIHSLKIMLSGFMRYIIKRILSGTGAYFRSSERYK